MKAGITSDCSSKSLRINEKIRRAFHQDLASWYQVHARSLPWRKTTDPYAIIASELMLQQTQVITVIPYYERWLKRFPNWSALAEATEEEVLKQWEGLGYYTRARNFQRLAKEIQARGGVVPTHTSELIKLPGIGPYTAGAISSLAFGKRAALVDGNVFRVFARVWNWKEEISTSHSKAEMWALAERLLPSAKECGLHNSALMELGATVCLPRKPQCLLCPLKKVCRATSPEDLPVKLKTQVVESNERIALIERSGKWWVEPVPLGGRLAGFWRFPFWASEFMTPGEECLRLTYGITKYRVRLVASRCEWYSEPIGQGKWLSLKEMEKLSMPAAQRKVRSFLTGA